MEAQGLAGSPLPEDVVDFCRSTFESGGAILSGPGGGRFVYELRRRFDLFCKISPIRVSDSLARSGRFRPESVRGVDLLVVRENAGGVYMGESSIHREQGEGRVCEHRFRYSEREVRRILDVAATLAASRRGGLAVVVKDGGLPEMTSLWRDVAEASASRCGLRPVFLNVDLASFALVHNPRDFDVVVASNLFGDILADGASVLLGSRGLSFSGNFSASGAAVYQTNHGGAADIAGLDQANPIGQIASLAMALRESFGLQRESDWIENGIEETLQQGFRTPDIAGASARIVGTREMGARIAAAVGSLATSDRR
jgi:3-isopropylmalate dehydrogenase